MLDGKRKNAQRRKYCFKCSAIGGHNTRKLERICIITQYSRCSRCKNTLSIDKFYTRSDKSGRPHSMCKQCNNNLTKEKQRTLKLTAISYKGGKCMLCGYNKHPSALEFHHTDPKKKDFTIASRATASFSTIKTELDKCILVCSNCHREEHHKNGLKNVP